ncbi:hypothetical protein BC828DRAFT_382602 [Blastocladiella britannica]|nr:hypothetical protein BC828DRAFT_382602 [Blastocladiella britannica]
MQLHAVVNVPGEPRVQGRKIERFRRLLGSRSAHQLCGRRFAWFVGQVRAPASGRGNLGWGWEQRRGAIGITVTRELRGKVHGRRPVNGTAHQSSHLGRQVHIHHCRHLRREVGIHARSHLRRQVRVHSNTRARERGHLRRQVQGRVGPHAIAASRFGLNNH